jgi:NAD(P)-dependent dehydrogenase (short-subunit alcohol dehydrogenase family)
MTPPREFDIAGKVFVIMGAGRGIGRGIAEVFSEAGADGAIAALTPTYVRPLAERLAGQSGRRILGLVADATSAQDTQSVVDTVLREFDRIDIWVNAVGDAIRKPLVPLPKEGGAADTTPLTDNEWRTVLDVNLTSTMVGCRAIGPYFLERGAGRIINIGSFAGRRGGAELGAYAAAKAGVSGITRALALEWAGSGVTVNCIAPGSFPDPEQSSPEQLRASRQRAEATIPLRRPGEVREVGLLALYLASDAAAYMTGQTLYLDGGMTL